MHSRTTPLNEKRVEWATCLSSSCECRCGCPLIDRLRVGAEGEQGEIVAVEVVADVEDVGEAGSGGSLLVPCAVRTLMSPQPENAFADGIGFGVIGGDESDDGPGGLRGSAGSGLELERLVTFAAFTPAAVGVLRRLARERDLRVAQDAPSRTRAGATAKTTASS
jgi:hypothetical protein